MLSAIENRRSIRKYQTTEVPKHLLEEILRAGILAPSSKNRQPWRFVVVTDRAKAEALGRMREGLAREREHPLLSESGRYLSGAEATLKMMEQAPAVIFIVNRLGEPFQTPLSFEGRVYEICNAQSIGAAIENMTLEATELGLGSLWICDTFFAYGELQEYLHAEGELFAALAVGYADEAPAARPREDWKAVVEWREDSASGVKA